MLARAESDPKETWRKKGTRQPLVCSRLAGPSHRSLVISYRHVERDRQWAEWLNNALESY